MRAAQARVVPCGCLSPERAPGFWCRENLVWFSYSVSHETKLWAPGLLSLNAPPPERLPYDHSLLSPTISTSNFFFRCFVSSF